MDIRVIPSYKNAHDARGLVVIIDVCISFTTACFLVQNGGTVALVATIDEAYTLKKRHPAWVLVGNYGGIRPPSFDYFDSPVEIKKIDFTGKTIVLLAPEGVRGILQATHAQEIIAASFVNAGAVIDYIVSCASPAVSLVCTEDRYRYNEDLFCVSYIKNTLEGKRVDFRQIKQYLTVSPAARGFVENRKASGVLRDFNLCLTIDMVPVVLKVRRGRNNLLFLDKVINV
ncbi:MAG TPA: 2-phosphosulfolactate phosphatase [Patescibacteria group bacterium]|nr:2-phosphosulfolactate phosphatase [Patescibacteria group bacterium]